MRLFQTGQTEDIIGFELQDMQKCLQDFHPTSFEDLTTLCCLNNFSSKRIPTLIKKNNSKKDKYPIPCMEKCLQNTYGVIVYQEQLMMLSRLIAGFNECESNRLRKVLHKRLGDELPNMKDKFIEGGMKHGYSKKVLEKVWNEMDSSGLYTYNKAHFVCCIWLDYQMAYLKANYPDEFKQVMNNRRLYHNNLFFNISHHNI